MRDKYIEIPKVVVEKETDKALLVLTENGEKVWIPKSQVSDDSAVYAEGHEGTLLVSKWIVEQKEELEMYISED